MKPVYPLLLFFISLSIMSTGQEIGIIMGTARHLMQEDIEEGLIRLKELGIRHIEGAGSRTMSREEYKKLLDRHGFDVIASGASFERLEQPDSIARVIDNMKFFGAEYAVCYWIPHSGDDFTFADMDKAVTVFNRAGKQLADAGIALVYHPHGYEFRLYEGPGTLFDYMMEKTDPRYINFQMDVFWIRNPGQDPAALLRKYPGRFPLTHLKDRMIGSIDNQHGRQDRERNVVLGQGDVNIAEVMKAARETGVKYHLIEDESARAMLQLPMHLQYLRSLNYDVQAVELSVYALRKAMLSGDSLALYNLTCEELTYGHSSGLTEDQKTFIDNLVSKKVDFSSIEFLDQEITVKGDVAWVRHTFKGEILDNGNKNAVNLKNLLVWTKVNGIWKLLVRQAVRS